MKEGVEGGSKGQERGVGSSKKVTRGQEGVVRSRRKMTRGQEGATTVSTAIH